MQPEPVDLNALVDDFLKSHVDLVESARLDWEPADENREDFYRSLAAQTGRSYEDLTAAAKKLFGIDKPDKPMTQKEIGTALKDARAISSREDCAACHR